MGGDRLSRPARGPRHLPRARPALLGVALLAVSLGLAAGPAPSIVRSAPGTGFQVFLPVVQRFPPGLFVDPASRAAALAFYQEHYLTSEGAASNWTGSQAACLPGSTGLAFRQAVFQRLNYFRAMAGVPANITFSDDSNRLAQAAALLMSANRQLSHSPPATWACYSADGAAGAGSSDLFLGVYGWDAITGYMQDPGSGNYALGHRRWILYPQTQVMGTGDIPPTPSYPPANALRVFDDHMWDPRPPTREAFVAWPPPGYVPYTVVFARWSFALAGADFSTATVSMQSNNAAVPLAQSPVVSGYGENTLAWIPLGLNDGSPWPLPASDTSYAVTIHHVLLNSQSRDFSYSVTVFNP